MENHNEGCPYGIHEFQVYQQQQHHGTTTTTNISLAGGGEEGSERISGEACASVVPWSLPPVHSISPVQFHTSNSVGNQDCFLPSFPSLSPAPQPSPPPYYGELFARRASTALQFAYDGSGVGLPSDPLGLAGFCTGPQTLARAGAVSSSSSYPIGGLQAPFTKMTSQEIMDAKALAASKSHSEAERRRRERINGHLAKLRSLLPSSTKTDKASLLAEVIQHVKELRRQTSEIAEESPLPTETDELTVDTASDDEGRFVVRASLCCEDRSDLLPDLIKALKALKLRALKAEITTLGGRVKNVLVITGEDDSDCHQQQQSISIVQDALKAVMEQAPADETSSGVKRQRTNSLANVLEHRSI